MKALKNLVGKSHLGPRTSKGKNKPPSVSAQFNVSLKHTSRVSKVMSSLVSTVQLRFDILSHIHVNSKLVVYSVTPKPGRWDFVNIEKIHSKYQFRMGGFIIVIPPPSYGEI